MKEQLAFQMEQVKRESELKVRRPCAQGLALECAPPHRGPRPAPQWPPPRPTVAPVPPWPRPHHASWPRPTAPPGPIIPVTHCPHDSPSIPPQLEEQSDQLEKLRRELEAKAGELVRVQEALSHTEQVGVGRLASDGTGVRVLFPRERALPGCHWVGSGVPGGCSDPVRRGLAGSGKLGASWGW